MKYIMGLDLGQVKDFTALSILRKEEQGKPLTKMGMLMQSALDDSDAEDGRSTQRTNTGMRTKPELHLGHLSRFPLGTPYTVIVRDLAALMAKEPYRGNSILVVDKTGVGVAVTDLIRDAGLEYVAVSITAGSTVTGEAWSDGGYGVPKKDLVTSLGVALEAGRLKIQRHIPLARLLLKECANFRYRIGMTGHATYDSSTALYREAPHDDLVLSVSLAVWYADFAGATLQIFIR